MKLAIFIYNSILIQIELITIMYAGTESHWPLTVIDLDRRIVCTSSPYPKHRTLKLLKQRNDITQILKGTGVDFKDSIIPKMLVLFPKKSFFANLRTI